MVVRKEKWDAGTPCWVDIMAGDLARSQAFYASVLGWDYTESQPEYGGYCNATVKGEVVAGLSPTMPGMEESPHVWTTYLATDDAEATKAAVLAAGGQVMVEPMVVGPFGTMAVYVDPTGAAFGTWQSGENTGFDLATEPGGVFWNDAMVEGLRGGERASTPRSSATSTPTCQARTPSTPPSPSTGSVRSEASVSQAVARLRTGRSPSRSRTRTRRSPRRPRAAGES